MRHRARQTARAGIAGLVLGAALIAQARADAPGTARLVELCKLWGTVKYLHPALVTRPIDWDAALLRAIPRVREAKSEGEYGKALEEMLAALEDPATRIVEAAPPTTVQPITRHVGKVLVVSWAAEASTPILDELGKATAVVVDLRGTAKTNIEATFKDIDDELAGVELKMPAVRVLRHEGYAPQKGETSGGYRSRTRSMPGELLRPRTAVPARRLVFIADATSWIPPLVPALQASGRARLLADGVPIFAPVRRTFPLSGQKVALIRTGDLEAELHVDAAIPDGAKAVEQAVALARSGWKVKPRPAASLPEAKFPPEKTYDDMPAPDLSHRLLALFRLWTVIDKFYPYKHLIGDWNAVLPDLIPRFEAAADARAYALAVAEASTRVPDGHTNVNGHPELASALGKGAPLAIVRRIEGKPVIVDFPDPALVKDKGLAAGDVVLSIGGEPIEKRVEGLRPYVTASTKTALENRLLLMALRPRGPAPVEIAVMDKAGARKTATIAPPQQPYQRPPVQGEPWRTLSPDIGYVDLTKLEVAQVDPMFAALDSTKAIIFDMRGYPRGTAWSIAPRINVKHATVGAVFRRQVIDGGMEDAPSHPFEQPIPPSGKLYAGKTVMLIDDRAISQSEHSGLFYEAAAGITFIGSTTAGANGDVTNFPLPGGIWFIFTGHDVRHADGRQLQRVGLTPHIRVEPTLAGIRAGKDEVLDRAVQWVRTGK
jgi:C-terminal processing protease CtpA/Prc